MTALQRPAPKAITLRIATVRSQRVIVDAELATLYGVQTKRFNEAVKRNLGKFPADFMFTLSAEEFGARTILISNASQVCLTSSRVRSATSPVSTLYRYFVTHTEWYSI